MNPPGTGTEGESQLLGVTCNHCGAPLSVPGEARFVTCTYCGTRLEVHLSGGAAYTQVLSSIDQRTERIEHDVAELKVRERVDQLDREWMMQRDQFMVRNKNGTVSMPRAGGAIFGSIAVAVFGVFWTGLTIAMGAPFFFPIFGVIFIFAAITGGISSVSKAAGYSHAQQKYELRRRELLDELNRQGK